MGRVKKQARHSRKANKAWRETMQRQQDSKENLLTTINSCKRRKQTLTHRRENSGFLLERNSQEVLSPPTVSLKSCLPIIKSSVHAISSPSSNLADISYNQIINTVSSKVDVHRLNASTTLPPKLTGRRIVAVNSLNNAILAMTEHSSSCKSGPIKLDQEKRKGLETILVYACGCGMTYQIKSSDDTTSLEANEGLAWGCHASATGFSAASSLLTTLDIQPPAYLTFKRYQDTLQHTLLAASKANMKKWALKEMELAIAANDFVMVEGTRYPAIMVIVDGGWSKRSYGHSYSANCGTAVIIGMRTGKVIYNDVKITTCAVCDRKRSNEIPPHNCSKNWSGPPTGMESAIILEGFMKSIKDYGLVYSSFIGDGDSSVHAAVQNVYPGVQVKKIECKNHVVRNFTTKLMDIASNRVKGADSKISADQRRVVNPRLARLRVALRQAIRYNSENSSDHMDLRNDILNIPMHVFGNHSKCRGYYQCNEQDVNIVPLVSKMNLWAPLMRAIDRVAGLSQSLLLNKTSNSAECFMSVACKYLEGKRKNFGQRGLYKIRMAGAVLDYNESNYWANIAFKDIKGRENSSQLWNKLYLRGYRKRQMKAKYRVRRPLKFPILAEKRGDLNYGSNPQKPDIDDETLRIETKILEEKLQVTATEAAEIEFTTRGQSDNPEWFRQRYGRITASFAPTIFKLKDTTSNKSALDDYFGKKRVLKTMQVALQYGKDNEKNAVRGYEEYKGFQPGTVKPAGLYVSTENGILGASPDGTVGADGIVEVKCPHSLYLKSKNGKSLHPKVWKESSPSSCSLKRDKKSGELKLNKSHDHYRQIIMQLYICDKLWCDYVVWSEGGIYVERIERSAETDELWLKMKQKDISFWRFDLAPELIDSRIDRGYKDYRSPSTRRK